MKITELTQKTRAAQLAEDRKKIDEVLPALWAAAGVGSAAWTAWDAYDEFKKYNRGEIDAKELASRVGTDVALSAIGGGIGGLAKGLSKAGIRGAKKFMGYADEVKGAKDAVAKAKDNVKAAKELDKQTPKDSLLKPGEDKIAAKSLRGEADAELKAAQKELDKFKILDKRGAVKGVGTGSIANVGLNQAELNPFDDYEEKPKSGARSSNSDVTPKTPVKRWGGFGSEYDKTR